ncbi:MAG: hypothetical protein LBE18_04715, partial [Planctomycetaceae bacterium]|nr:hypothetical protein [Planctomycetaceae bacterium]
NGKYPDKLDNLVPKYLDIIPIDPFTGRTTFVYKLRETTTETTSKEITTDTTPKEELPKQLELPYILYSFGRNGKDDNGTPAKPTQPSSETSDDIVF